VNGSNPPAGDNSHNHAPEPAGHIHPADPPGPHDPVHADPASVAADSAQHGHGEDGNSIDVQHGHDQWPGLDHDHGHGHNRDHDHEHPMGVKGFFYGLLVPHSHDAADSIDDALEASTAGVRAVKISLILLAITATSQIVVVVSSGSVALLADTIHNFSDALTAVPLWVAFVLSRRAATWRYTYGYGRVEDLAGVLIVAMIGFISDVETVRMRWLGHRLSVEVTVTSDPAMPVGRFHELEHQADDLIRRIVPGVAAVRLNPSAHVPANAALHL